MMSTDSSDAPQSPEMSKMDTFMATLRITHTKNLSDLMTKYPNDFAGDVYSDGIGGKTRIDDLPVYLLPMCAPFTDEFASDFVAKLNKFKHSVQERRVKGKCDGSPFAIVYVRSSGGDVAVLKRMLLAMGLIKRDLQVRYVMVIEYAYSCGFILAMSGCLVVSNGNILCHEPSLTQQVGVRNGEAFVSSTTQSATVTANDLRLTQEEIYSQSELAILLRYITKHREKDAKQWVNKSDVLLHHLIGNIDVLRAWRKEWYDAHQGVGQHMHAELFPGEPLGDQPFHVDTNILNYITGTLAGNRHEFMITMAYQLQLDLVDAIDTDFELASTDHARMSKSDMSIFLGTMLWPNMPAKEAPPPGAPSETPADPFA
jgi:hypothetical protein